MTMGFLTAGRRLKTWMVRPQGENVGPLPRKRIRGVRFRIAYRPPRRKPIWEVLTLGIAWWLDQRREFYRGRLAEPRVTAGSEAASGLVQVLFRTTDWPYWFYGIQWPDGSLLEVEDGADFWCLEPENAMYMMAKVQAIAAGLKAPDPRRWVPPPPEYVDDVIPRIDW